MNTPNRLIINIFLCSLLIVSVSRADLVYDYDARDLSTGMVATWNDNAGVAMGGDLRNWSLTGGSPTVNPFAHPVLDQVVSFNGSQANSTNTTGTFANGVFTTGTDGRDASFEMWFRPNGIGTAQLLFETGGTTNGLALQINADGTLTMLTRRSNNNTNVNSALLANISNLTQVVGVVDSGTNTTRIYINGVQSGSVVGTRAWTFGTDPAGLATLNGQLGATSGTANPFSGDIALFRIYDNALTSPEVASIYVATIPEPSSMLFLAMAGFSGYYYRKRRSPK